VPVVSSACYLWEVAADGGGCVKRSEPMQLGFVGTETMWNPMARCLIEAGHQLTVYDLRRQTTGHLC
jgi:hypothetical protein